MQALKIDRGWKFYNQKVEEFYYPCSKNKGADQLRSYCEADLRFCFCICKMYAHDATHLKDFNSLLTVPISDNVL